jgi:thiamine-phosphate pyrophosphorylase
VPGLDGDEIRRRLADARLYLCTGLRPDLAEFADAALAGGVDVIQLREKGIEAREELDALAVLASACARHGALLSVNDRADIAGAARADVLHLGQNDLPLAHARALIGDGVLIGRSTHDPRQARQAATEAGLDYFSVGPCWATPTKPGRAPAGLDLVRVAADVAGDRPFYPIGGIDFDRLPQVLATGARRIAVVRAINAAPDPRAAARQLKAALGTP